MGGTPYSAELFNAREISLSSDLNRLQRLASRELQNTLAGGSADAGGLPFSSLLTPIALTATSGFQMTISDADGWAYLPSDSSLTTDDSAFEVLRWRSAPALTFANPSGSNPRIDLVVATPGSVSTDASARNVLVDPVSRTVAVQTVNKTQGPASTITVVTGTPGATPAPPAVPTGTVALFEVYVATTAASSADFLTVQRIFRRAPFPYSTMSGIVSGLHLRWDLTADPASTASTITLNNDPSTKHRVLIDGELIEWTNTGNILVTQDAGGQNPFASPAGSSDQPYYIYAVGGRHCPQGGGTSGHFYPVALVESLVPPAPDNYGRPVAGLPITTPRGVTTVTGAVYIGLGFVVAGSTRRRAMIQTDDMSYIVGGDFAGALTMSKSGSGPQLVGTPGSKPPLSTKAVLAANFAAAVSASAVIHLVPGDGTGSAAAAGAVGSGINYSPMMSSVPHTSTPQTFFSGMFFFSSDSTIWAAGTNLNTLDALVVIAQAYDHRVTRLGGYL